MCFVFRQNRAVADVLQCMTMTLMVNITSCSLKEKQGDRYVKMLNGRVLLFWIVTRLEVAERLSRPSNTSLIKSRV
jgi:hypothetical protein